MKTCQTRLLPLSLLISGALLSGGCERTATAPKPSEARISAERSDESGGRTVAGVDSNPEQSLARAEAAISNSDHTAARRHLRELLVQVPEHAAGLFLMARLEAESNHLAEAVDLLAAVPLNDPDFGVAALGQRADYLRELGRLNESVAAWQQLLELDDSLDLVRSRLAEDLYRVGRRIEAGWVLQELAERSAASEDELRRLLNVTRWPKSREERLRASSLSDRDRAGRAPAQETLASSPRTLSQAWDLVHERRYREAFAVLEEVADREPSNQAMALLALVQSQLQLFDALQETLERATDEIERFPSYWMAVGDDWLRRDEDRLAVAAYSRALLADPTWDLTHDRLVGALLKIGETRLAREVDERKFALSGPLEAFLAVGPGQPEDERAGRFLIGDLERLGQTTQACAWLKHLAKRHPQVFGDAQTVRAKCDEWTSLSAEQLEKRRLAGLDLQAYPDPAPKLRSGTERGKPPRPAPNAVAGAITPPKLIDVARDLGLEVVYHNLPERKSRLLRLHESLGSGVAAIDFDRDGWIDFYFGQASGDPPEIAGTRPNVLVRKVDGRLQDVTVAAGVDDRGYAIGVSAGDWNQDGWEDLIVGNLGPNRLWLNQGDGTFVDATDQVGIAGDSFTSSLAFGDVDGDGLTDLVEVSYADDPSIFDPLVVDTQGIARNYPGPNRFRSGLDTLWLAQADGRAQQMPLQVAGSPEPGVASPVSTTDPAANAAVPRIGDAAYPGLGLVMADFDFQPGLEVFVANDLRPNQWWRVDRRGNSVELSETAASAGLATNAQGKTTACMGAAVSDFDRNGRPDLLVTNWFDEWVNFYLQRSVGVFQDVAPVYALDRYSDHHLGFGTQAIDYDNNGWMDLLIGNGHIDDFEHLGLPRRMPTQLLIHRVSHFEEADLSEPGSYWETAHLGRCVIVCDHNRDGRMDAVITDLEDPVALLENRTETDQRFIQFHLVGTQCERSAVGARVEVLGASEPQVAVVAAGDGYLGRNEPLVHFGLGPRDAKVTVEVSWADGTSERHGGLEPDRRYLLIQGEPPFALP